MDEELALQTMLWWMRSEHVISLICIIIRNLFTRKFKKIPCLPKNLKITPIKFYTLQTYKNLNKRNFQIEWGDNGWGARIADNTVMNEKRRQ